MYSLAFTRHFLSREGNRRRLIDHEKWSASGADLDPGTGIGSTIAVSMFFEVFLVFSMCFLGVFYVFHWGF